MLFMLWPGGAAVADSDTISVTTEQGLIDTVANAVYAGYTISIDEDISLTSGNLSIGQNITLTSSVGKTLDALANSITIPAGQTVTINGDLEVTGSGTSVIEVAGTGSFTLDGSAAVRQTGSSSSGAIKNNGGTITINGGTVESSHTGINNDNSAGTVTVTSGTVTGTTNAINSYGTLNVSGGTIGSTTNVQNGIRVMDGTTTISNGNINANYYAVSVGTGSTANISISGGIFNASHALSCSKTTTLTGGTFNGKVTTNGNGIIHIDRSSGDDITLSASGVSYSDSGQLRSFLTSLPAVPITATQGQASTVSLTGTYNGVTFAVDDSTDAKLGATANGSGSTATVNMTPTESGSYKLVLTAAGTGSASGQTFKLTLPVTVTAASLTPLAAPTGLVWDTTTPGKAKWNAVTAAASYSVQLYKGGTAQGSAASVASDTLEHDFTADITTTGTYTFKVIAVGNGTTNSDSPESAASPGYSYTTAPAGTTGNPVWSYRSPLPSSSRIINMKVLDGKFWAVGENGTLLRSEEGVNWEKINIGNPANLLRLEGITYGDGTYMLVGRLDEYASAIYTSTDGTTWTEKAAIPHNLRDVAFGDGKFVAVGRPGKIMVSDDNGASWQTIVPVYPDKKSYYLQSITYADDKFVAVGMGSDTGQDRGGIMTSADGVNWEFPYTDANNYIRDVAYGGGNFVAVGGKDSGPPFICTSPNGTIWSPQDASALTFSSLYAVKYAGGKFVAVGRTHSGYSAYAATSPNGSAWSDNTASGLPGFNTLASNGTSWVATNGMGNIYRSSDGPTSWNYMTKGSTNTLNDVAYNGSDLYVAVGEAGTIQTSGDGVTWTIQTSGTTQNLNKVDFMGGQFIAVGKNGTILTSSDGASWTARTSGTNLELYGIAFDGSGKYVVVGGDYNWSVVILTSVDAKTWNIITPSNINVSLSTVAFGDGVFITLTRNGAAFTSVDGATWAPAGSFSGYPRDLIYAGGKFAAVGGSGAIYLSDDQDSSWTIVKSDFDQYNRSIAYGGGNFIAVGDLGNIIASADGGTTWYRQPSGLEQNPHSYENDFYTDLKGVTAGNNCFMAVGASGLVLKSDMAAVSNEADAHDVAIAKSVLYFDKLKHNADNDGGQISRGMNLMTALSAPTDVPPGSGALTVDISWHSSKPTVISNNGNVTRPTFEQGDQVVYLTATFTKGAAVDTKTFIVRVVANEYVAPLTDAQRVAAAKAALGDGTVTVPAGADQAAKTAAVQSYVNGLLAAVPDAEGVAAMVTYNSGTGEYDVALSKGVASDSRSIDILIIETADPDYIIVSKALTEVENATYGSISQGAATSEAAIKAAIRAIAIAALSNNSVTVTVNTVSYSQPVAGTAANPSGTNGSYTFTVTVSKGAVSLTTAQKTVAISATAYTSPGSSGGGSSSSTPSGTLVTSSGSNVSHSGVALSFPAGAVESDVWVQVREAALTSGMSLPADSQLISKVLDIVKDKSGNFAKPVTVTMSFNRSQIDPDKYDIKICYFDEEKGQWVELDNIEVDMGNGKVSGQVKHFTKFAVFATPKAVEKEEVPTPEPQLEFKLPGDIAGHWAQDSIVKLIQNGVINGYTNGSFQPEKEVSRAEFTVMLVKALKLESKQGTVFKDTAGHWAKDSIATASAHGIISGYDQNSFGPDNRMTREQAAVIIARAAKLKAGGQVLSFNDAKQVSPWALSGVTAVVGNSYMSGYPDNSFRPQGFTSRAEAAVIIAQLLKM